MSNQNYPTSGDLYNFLIASGVSASTASGLDLNTLILAGKQEFEGEIGRTLLASGTSARYFDVPPYGSLLLDLRDDLYSLSSSGLAVGSTVLTENSSFYLRPYRAPYQYVKFVSSLWGSPRIVSVSGSWGMSNTIPEDAFLAILIAAARTSISQTNASIILAGNVSSMKQGTLEVRYGSSSSSSTSTSTSNSNSLDNFYENAVNKYRRVFVA